jgi:heat shock protein HspQ
VKQVQQAQFRIGQIVQHKLFDYRGVIFEIDGEFSLTDEWYEEVARSRPPKDQPWYHVLVDNGMHTTYVAERNLVPSDDFREIHHPGLDKFFSGFHDGFYIPKQKLM